MAILSPSESCNGNTSAFVVNFHVSVCCWAQPRVGIELGKEQSDTAIPMPLRAPSTPSS